MTSDRSTRASLVQMGSTRRGTPADVYPARGFREKSVVLDAAVDEYLRLQRAGTPISKEEFCQRYPDYRHSLKRLIDVEEALPAFDEMENDFWPEVGGCFLGYDIRDLLGAGSIARVFLASEIKLGGRAVAIKVSKHGGYEAETLGKLRHSNIVEVYSVNHDEKTDLTVVCMPYQGSATLSDLLDAAYRKEVPPAHAAIIAQVGRQMALPAAGSDEEHISPAIQKTFERGTYVDGVVYLGMQLASALQYAHDHGVLHRDLKPSNVLLTPLGRPMLLDFNLSFDEALNMVHRGGTLPYSAPEQLREATQVGPVSSSAVGVKADIFSLGAILYELLTGKLPYGSPPSEVGPRQAISLQLESQNKPLPSIRGLNAQVDAHLEGVIMRCLDVDPAKRFANMSELELELQAHFLMRRRVNRWMRRHPIVSLSTTGLVSTAAVGSAVFVASIPPAHVRERLVGIQAATESDSITAVASFSRSLKSQPKDGDTLYRRGVARQRLNDHANAILDFEEAQKAGYDSAALWEHLGFSLFKEQKSEKLLKHYVAACAKHPTSGNLQLAKAYSRHVRDDNVGAMHDLDEFIQNNPERYEGWLFRAIVRVRIGRAANMPLQYNQPLQDSVRDIDEACAKSPKIAVVEFEAAKILGAASKSDATLTVRAKAHLQAAAELGYTSRSIKTAAAFSHWLMEPWFQNLLEQCESNESNPEPSLAVIAFQPDDLATN